MRNKDTRRAFMALSREMEPEIKVQFLSAIGDLTSTAQILLVEQAIASGDVSQVLRALQLREEVFHSLDDAIRTAFLAGGAYQLDSVPKKTKDPLTGGRLVIRFGGSQPRAAEISRRLGASLITNITDTAREVVSDIISDGLQDGVGHRRLALDLSGRIGATGRRTGGVIGLTSPNAKTVSSVRSGFRSGDTDRIRSYLTLKGRDKRFDGIVERALQEGKPLSAVDTNRITGRLSDIYLRKRGEDIAQQETLQALSAGRREATQQIIDRGVVPESAVTHGWDATGDARTREDHMFLESQFASIPWGQPFIAPDGSRMMPPRDSSLGASAKQTVKCRCYEKITVDYLAGAI